MNHTAIARKTSPLTFKAQWGGDQADPEIIVADTIAEAAEKLAAIIEAVEIEDLTVTVGWDGVTLTSPDYSSDDERDTISEYVRLEAVETCGVCGEIIAPGDETVSDSDDGRIHETCAPEGMDRLDGYRHSVPCANPDCGDYA